MLPKPVNQTGGLRHGPARHYVSNVMDGHALPSVPVVANKLLEIVQDPEVSMQQLCRVLADDPMLSARVLAVSRSPRFALRNLPTTLLGAVQVLGFRTLTSVVITSATQSLRLKGNKVSEKLWRHSLGVALAMRILCQRARSRDDEIGFLIGLMHDVGQMVFVHGDPMGYENLLQAVQEAPRPIVDAEREIYGVDHALMGHTILNRWNLDAQIIHATLKHHSDGASPNELANLLTVADYLSSKCNLGFFTMPTPPPEALLVKCGLTDETAMAQLIAEIVEAHREESLLFEK
ncbi:MAG: HDOD domain-containing protein [Deltaproteobacteria bacterium]|nr:HDOD domain-containing protein [Deltaproteobacteria bacterium]